METDLRGAGHGSRVFVDRLDRGTGVMAGPRKSKAKGCFFVGCLCAAVVALIAALVVGFLTWRVKSFTESITDDVPAPIPALSLTAEEADEIGRKVGDLASAIDQNRAESFRFDQWELNAAIATHPETEGLLKGKVYLSIEGDRLKAQTSIPFDEIPGAADVPGLGGRYLNANVDLDIRCDNGVLDIAVEGLEAKGEPLPDKLRQRLSELIREKIAGHPRAAAGMPHIDSIRVADGNLIIRTRKKQLE